MRRELDGQMWESWRTVFISRSVKLSHYSHYIVIQNIQCYVCFTSSFADVSESVKLWHSATSACMPGYMESSAVTAWPIQKSISFGSFS